ncbi:MAG: NAD(P)-dependent alcohol dehydrogenase [Mucilaginibacter sp.]
MKAVIINKFGPADELYLSEIPIPDIKGKEILVKNYYTTVNPMDCKVRAGQFKLFAGSRFPKVLGCESAGVVEKVGEGVTSFKKGDKVMAYTGFKFGTYAEYVAVNEKNVFRLSDKVNFKYGSSLPSAGCTAHNGLFKTARIRKGDNVLINGAYGGIGSIAVQLAKLAGATVTGVCSTENLENVRALHADYVIDYTVKDVYAFKNQFDIVFDTVGKLNVRQSKDILKNGGVFVTTVGSFSIMCAMMLNLFQSKKIKSIWNNPTQEELDFLSDRIYEQKLNVVTDREYQLTNLPEAHTYSETGKAKGKIFIKI